MPGALIDRPKMTKTMYQALKRHIMKERERKKQEQEQDAMMMERLKKEEEMKKKKEQEDSLTLEQTKEQISQLDKKMEDLKTEKHELFSQLKKVLHQEDETRKKAQLKEQSELQIMQHSTVLGLPHAMSGRPMLYRPPQPTMVQQVAMKRGRSPSPPPSQSYQYSNKMMAASIPVEKQHPYTHSSQPDYKQQSNFPQSQTGAGYPTQAGHTYQQAGYVPSKSPVKYNPGGQSAFSSYSNPYTHPQTKQLQEAGYPAYRMQQPSGYIATQHGSNIPLQKQLEHANQQSGFNEEKYKLQQSSAIRGVAPLPGQQSMMHQPLQIQQQQQQSKGSIVTGYAARGQTPNSTSQYPPTSNQPNYTTQSRPQHHMSGQHPGRYF
ncbi:G protein pathway suppressor 2-like isoform X2 [Ostrea edulis]|uniref:G protein pathway suppressor 2-like isoform X2 n=1 Tax=Ostrea edulis TaxID=37623 RepID=UPI002095FB2A|nr:G protein pathway suppressor 2-like isoform X2 [Ostrea edulis]